MFGCGFGEGVLDLLDECVGVMINVLWCLKLRWDDVFVDGCHDVCECFPVSLFVVERVLSEV